MMSFDETDDQWRREVTVDRCSLQMRLDNGSNERFPVVIVSLLVMAVQYAGRQSQAACVLRARHNVITRHAHSSLADYYRYMLQSKVSC